LKFLDRLSGVYKVSGQRETVAECCAVNSQLSDENVVWLEVGVNDLTPMHLMDHLNQLHCQQDDKPLLEPFATTLARIHQILQSVTHHQ